MKYIIFIFLLSLFSFPAISQKVTVQVIKEDKNALSEWQILDDEDNLIISGNDYPGDDIVTFSLEANKRYFFHVSVFEISYSDTTLYSLGLNEEPILLVKSGMEPGDYYFPFFTGVRNQNVKITGGTDADIADFPWQVFYISGNFRCGGTIIGENWILTAAHCTEDSNGNLIPASEMSVKVGATDPSNLLEGKTYDVSDVIVHEGFNSQSLVNDIALLKLNQPINYINATPIRLITSDDVAEGAADPGVMSWVTGWGLTNVTPEVFPNILQKVQLPIVSNAQASVVWKTIPSTDIMAGYLNGNKDACNGDSGGPLVVPVFGEYKIAGIVSWGSSDCNTYGGYTRVSDFETWIRANTGIVKEYKPPSPTGDTLICQGVTSSLYSVDIIPDVTAYEWELIPSTAGVVSGNSANATVVWNLDFTGSATLILRVTQNGVVSDWSWLKLKVVKNTVLLSQSGDTSICAGQPVELVVEADGYNLTYNWYKDSQLVQNGSSGILSISGATTDNSGDYTCEISGYCGTINSENIKLIVYPVTNITYISPDRQVLFGNDITLEVDAEGYNLIYQWQKDETLLDNSNTSRLNLTRLNAGNIGLYTVTVEGICGTEISDKVYVYVKKSENPALPEVFLWPTITTGSFNLALSNDEYYNVSIFNTSGKLIREVTNCQYQITLNLDNVSGGIYIITVFNNNFRRHIKLIKH